MTTDVHHALVQVEAQRISREWVDAPPLHVVQTPQDLPVPNAPADARGMHLRGQLFLVSGAMYRRELPKLVAHEAIAHWALRDVLGDSWRRFALAVSKAARKGGDVALRRVRHRVREVYVDPAGRPCLRPRTEGDEVTAALAEELVHPYDGTIIVGDEFAAQAEAAASYAARELGMKVSMTTRELTGWLLFGQRRLRTGSALGPIGYRARRAFYAAAAAAMLILSWWAVIGG